MPVLDDDLLASFTTYLASHPRRHEPDAPVWPGRRRGGNAGVLDYGTAEEPRYWDRESFYRNWFRPAVARIGLPAEPFTGVRFHDLRHTCASQWVEDGHELFYVSRWLGHESIAFTSKVYAKVAQRPDWSAAAEKTRAAKEAQVSNIYEIPGATG